MELTGCTLDAAGNAVNEMFKLEKFLKHLFLRKKR